MQGTIEQEIKWEVGQEVWDITFGKGKVSRVSETQCVYPVRVIFDNMVCETYDRCGRMSANFKRSLFFSEPVVTAERFPPKKTFKPTLNKGDLITIRDKHCGDVVVVSFLKEDNGLIYYTYSDGQKDYSPTKNVVVHPLGEEIKFN